MTQNKQHLSVVINGQPFEQVSEFAKTVGMTVKDFKNVETHKVNGVEYGNAEQLVEASGYVPVAEAAKRLGTISQNINALANGGKVLRIKINKKFHVNVEEVRQVLLAKLEAKEAELKRLKSLQASKELTPRK